MALFVFALLRTNLAVAYEKIAFDSNQNGSANVYIMNPDGSDVQQVTRNSIYNAIPCFSPDGQQIVFQSLRNGVLGIYIIDVDGNNEKCLTPDTIGAMEPTFSPDGKQIAYVSYQQGPMYAGYRVSVMDVDGGNQRVLTSDSDPYSNSSDQRPRYSPDGQSIVFYREQSDSETIEGYANLMLVNPSDGNVTTLTDNSSTLLYDRSPSFSPDGQTIIFNSAASGVEDGTLEQMDLYTIKVDGTERRQITSTPELEFNACYSPDGSKITFSGLENYFVYDKSDIFVMDAPSNTSGAARTTRTINDDGRTKITQNDSRNQSPDWVGVADPTLAINSPSVVEGNTGTRSLNFVLTLSKPIIQPVQVTVQTSNASTSRATAGTDYVALAPTVVTFGPRTTSRTVTVRIKGDTVDEDNERVRLALSAPSGVVLSTSGSEGTIVDDDGIPSLSVNDVRVSEGNRGLKKAVFTATLSNASSKPISFKWNTQSLPRNGAIAGQDYVTVQPTTVTFAPGQTSQTLSVSVQGDVLDELDEAFYVKLSSPVNARLFDGVGVGFILDDDAPPTASVRSTSVLEGNNGQSTLPFEVRLSGPSSLPISVLVRPLPGATFPATANLDYQATPLTTLRFAPGEISKTVAISVKGDSMDENNERVALELSRPVNVLLAQPAAEGVIIDDDGPSILSIDSVSITEGNRGIKTANFTVSLSAPSGKEVKVDFATLPRTASVGSDYIDQKGTLVFAPGESRKTISVVINGDTNFERDEQFVVVLSKVLNASIGTAVGIATILNDDTAPSGKSTPASSALSNSSSTS